MAYLQSSSGRGSGARRHAAVDRHHHPCYPRRGVGGEKKQRFDDVARLTVAADRVEGVEGRLCLCGMLGAEAPALPPAARDMARAFFAQSLARLTPSLGAERALGLIAVCEGAMVVARALGDPAAFEQAVARLAA